MFFDERVRSFMSRTAITLKFKMRWFPDEAGYSGVHIYQFTPVSCLMRIKTLVAL